MHKAGTASHGQSVSGTSRTGKHCLYSSLCSVLLRMKTEVAEADLFILAGSMNAEYEGKLRAFGPGTFGNQLRRITASEGPAIQVEAWDPQGGDPDKLVKALHAGYGTMLHVSSAALTYHEVYTINEPRGHVIELCGLETESRTAQVSDSFLLDSSGRALHYTGPARLDDLLGGMMEYAWLVEAPAALPPARVHQACALHIREYLTGRSGDPRIRRGDAAYRAFIADFQLLSDMDDREFRFFCGEIYYQLRIGTALTLVDYLRDYVMFHQHALGAEAHVIADRAQELHAGWHRLNLHLYKTGLQLDRRRVPTIMSRAHELADRQYRLFERLLPLVEDASQH
ncbi:BtrH N-terminal domain-containing protein [Paenibacillus sp. P96]|uniref:BtrH N-terminal domain-containing protein n=1 Tax=Paenibacillus zeirhizosphaerae TaxID=2987519 RepID=A0ABT9FLV3_9BACL|nr:hypothetical protein [Paenibacillus sp. P96]MDP4095717.1 BtrH N-terminal domain-containing protein [Paenibacillus sp. P96]